MTSQSLNKSNFIEIQASSIFIWNFSVTGWHISLIGPFENEIAESLNESLNDQITSYMLSNAVIQVNNTRSQNYNWVNEKIYNGKDGSVLYQLFILFFGIALSGAVKWNEVVAQKFRDDRVTVEVSHIRWRSMRQTAPHSAVWLQYFIYYLLTLCCMSSFSRRI